MQSIHFKDCEGDKIVAELDVEIEAANIQTPHLSYLVLSPRQLRRLADWVERAQDKTDRWMETPEAENYIDSIG